MARTGLCLDDQVPKLSLEGMPVAEVPAGEGIVRGGPFDVADFDEFAVYDKVSIDEDQIDMLPFPFLVAYPSVEILAAIIRCHEDGAFFHNQTQGPIRRVECDDVVIADRVLICGGDKIIKGDFETLSVELTAKVHIQTN